MLYEVITVKAFHEANAEKIGFYKFLQWVADEQLVAAKDAATAKGVLLYMDQAVGNAHDGVITSYSIHYTKLYDFVSADG